jgi:hypothetical protein
VRRSRSPERSHQDRQQLPALDRNPRDPCRSHSNQPRHSTNTPNASTQQAPLDGDSGQAPEQTTPAPASRPIPQDVITENIAIFTRSLHGLALLFPVTVRLCHYIERLPDLFQGEEIITPEMRAVVAFTRAQHPGYLPPWPRDDAARPRADDTGPRDGGAARGRDTSTGEMSHDPEEGENDIMEKENNTDGIQKEDEADSK